MLEEPEGGIRKEEPEEEGGKMRGGKGGRKGGREGGGEGRRYLKPRRSGGSKRHR